MSHSKCAYCLNMVKSFVMFYYYFLIVIRMVLLHRTWCHSQGLAMLLTVGVSCSCSSLLFFEFIWRLLFWLSLVLDGSGTRNDQSSLFKDEASVLLDEIHYSILVVVKAYCVVCLYKCRSFYKVFGFLSAFLKVNSYNTISRISHVI